MNVLPDSSPPEKSEQNYALHGILFLATVLTTLWAGAFWCGHPVVFDQDIHGFIESLAAGIPYSFSLLLFLSVHEFGHFFATVHHRIRATLPYYIPMPPLPMFFSLGTMGAIIKMRDRMTGTNALFDIGISGPLSGFIVCCCLLVYGFLNLPPADYIYTIHPEYLQPGVMEAASREGALRLGNNLLWFALEYIIAPKNLPPMTEMYHYPFLFAGWLGSVVTALNLLPVGQLDGGHIIYAMFGRKGHALTARAFILFITILGLPSLIELILVLLNPPLARFLPYELVHHSWSGWILWAIILSRFIGTSHPPTAYDHPLGTRRMGFGWVAIAIFILTFTPVPFGLT
ncbi:MAG: site-2 protease family protein [Chlorobiaceae bacterium]|jgi:membrane-associated protease RseP (regulator of RpoE activity)|nr:site-2 protease family protein [Chlorobiaceae bacterium]